MLNGAGPVGAGVMPRAPGPVQMPDGALPEPGSAGLTMAQRMQPARGVHSVDWTVLREIREILERRCREATGGVIEVDGEEPTVSAQEIADVWLEVAAAEQKRQGAGPLMARDKEFIEVRVSQSMREVDPKSTNKVDKDEWVHHMLLTRSSPRTMKAMMQINTLLDAAVDQCPGILVGLQHGFEVAHEAVLERERTKLPEEQEKTQKDDQADEDLLPSQYKLPAREVLSVFGRKLWHMRPILSQHTQGLAGFSSQNAEDFAADMIKAMDLDAFSEITYADFLALCLGRRERPVLLHLYDLSRGAARTLSPLLIDEQIQGVWHTGIVTFGKEYYFGGDIYYDVPAATGFGRPARVIMLGYTLRQREELHAFIVDEMKPIFSREAYDAARNNCNHFTDKLCMYLVGKHIPEEVLKQPELLVRTKLGQTLRPVLNRWLGFYFEPGGTQAAEVDYADGRVKNPNHTVALGEAELNEFGSEPTTVKL